MGIMIRVADGLPLRGRVRLRVHRIADIHREIPEWDALDRASKVLALRDLRPEYEEDRENVTTENLAKHLVDKLMGQAVPNVDHYAIGDGTATPLITNQDLASRKHTQNVTLLQDAGTKLDTSTFWDTGEANGIIFREGGPLAGGATGTPGSGGVLLARVLFASPQTKDNTKTFTVDHSLTFMPE